MAITLTSTTYSLKEFTDTSRRQVNSYTLIQQSFLWKSIPRKYYKRKCCTHKSVHFIIILVRGNRNYLYAQQQVDGLFFNIQKRLKIKISLLTGPPAYTLAHLNSPPSWFPQSSQKDSHKLFYLKPSNNWLLVSFKIKLKALQTRLSYFSRLKLSHSLLLTVFSKSQVHRGDLCTCSLLCL